MDLATPTLINRLGSQSRTLRRIVWNWLASRKRLKNTSEWRHASRMHPNDPQVKGKARDKSSVCSLELTRQRSRSTRTAFSESILHDASVRAASNTRIPLVSTYVCDQPLLTLYKLEEAFNQACYSPQLSICGGRSTNGCISQALSHHLNSMADEFLA